MEEIWKDIFGYEESYQVSNLGNIKSKNRIVNNGRDIFKEVKEKNLNVFQDCLGYKKVKLYKESKGKQFYVHRLVAKHFIENDSNLFRVNHKDCDISNNISDNLEWVSTSFQINKLIDNNEMKNIKVIIVDCENGNELKFRSQQQCAKYIGREKSYFTYIKKYKKEFLVSNSGKVYLFKNYLKGEI